MFAKHEIKNEKNGLNSLFDT